MKTKEQHLAEMLGIDGAAAILRDEGINALARKLAERKVERKSNDQPPAPAADIDEDDTVANAADVLLPELIETQAAQAADIEEIKSLVATQAKSYADKTTSLETKLDAFLEKANQLFDTPKRATEAAETKLTGKAAEAAKANASPDSQNGQYDPFFGDLGVKPQGGK